MGILRQARPGAADRLSQPARPAVSPAALLVTGREIDADTWPSVRHGSRLPATSPSARGRVSAVRGQGVMFGLGDRPRLLPRPRPGTVSELSRGPPTNPHRGHITFLLDFDSAARRASNVSGGLKTLLVSCSPIGPSSPAESLGRAPRFRDSHCSVSSAPPNSPLLFPFFFLFAKSRGWRLRWHHHQRFRLIIDASP